MKITCQSCQSKYTIADEKILGKVAKIRCRKCGETIEVDGTRLGAVENETPPAPTSAVAAEESAWSVNFADDDQRTMTLSELVEAYHSGVVTAETYLWAEGMADWAPLAEVPEVVAALGSFAPPEADEGAEPVRDSMFHEQPYGQGYDSNPAEAETAAAVSPRASGVDLFAASAHEDGDGRISNPHDSPTSTPQPLGARDEQSVLFSLSALTASAPKVSVPPSSTGPTEDSGLIDLNALAAKAQDPAPSEAEAVTPTPFLFPAALGSVEPVTTSTTAQAPAAQPASKAPLFIGAGIAVAGVAIALVMATRTPEPPPPAVAPPPTAAAVAPPAEPTQPEPAPSAEAPPPASSAAPAENEPAPAKKPAAPAKAKPAAQKPAAPKQPAAAPAGATKPAAAPASKKSNCGCAPADLQCQIRCSAMGK